MYIFSSIFIKNILTFVYIMLLCQGCYWIGKSANKKFSCVMVLIMRPNSTLKFQCFWFQWISLEIFSFLNFEKFLVLYFGCGCIFMTFDFMAQMTLSYLLVLPHANEQKTWVHRPLIIYYKMLRNICKKEV